MRKPLLSRGFLLTGVCVLSLAVLPGIGENGQSGAKRVPGIYDWTMRHVIYPQTGPIDKMIAAERDPRAMMIWQRRLGRWNWRHSERGRGAASKGEHRDWSIYLGQNGVAPAMYPAKFSFNIAAAPSCTTDFVVYPIDAAGSATQPNIVAFNNLYSGTAPAGLCTGASANVYWSYNVQGISGGGAVTTSPELSFDQSGTGTGKKVAFVESGSGAAHFHVLAWNAGDGQQASNLQSVGLGQIVGTPTVPAGDGGTGYRVNDTGTILGGTTVANYRITAATGNGTTPRRQATTIVLTSGSGFGYTSGILSTQASTGTGSGMMLNVTAMAPVTISSFSSGTPVIGSGTATDLPFGSSTDTLSSPYIDYGADTAYVGNDAGQLYRIKDVFCMGINGANHDCANESSGPAPSIDTTWGSGGFVQVCGGKLTAPAVDFATGSVFVGCSDGKLYGITQQGQVTSVQVGTGGTHGGIVAAPMVDDIDGFVYAVSGAGSASGGASGVLVQASDKNLASFVAVPIGTGGQCDAEEPAVNNAYLNGIASAGSLIYVTGITGTVAGCAPGSGNTAQPPSIIIDGATFGANGTLSAGAPASSITLGGGPGYQWAPLSEFYNATTGRDWLFLGALQNQTNLASVDITAGFFAGGVGQGVGGLIQEGMGPTGIIVDNDSSSGQASSIYLGAVGENTTCNNTTVTTDTGGCAVKLTQAALQ